MTQFILGFVAPLVLTTIVYLTLTALVDSDSNLYSLKKFIKSDKTFNSNTDPSDLNLFFLKKILVALHVIIFFIIYNMVAPVFILLSQMSDRW